MNKTKLFLILLIFIWGLKSFNLIYGAENLSLNTANPITANIVSQPIIPAQIKPTYSYQHQQQYIDLLIDGFIEGKLSNRDYYPKKRSGTIWETIQNDAVYKELPRDVLFGAPKFDMTMKLNIEGKLDKNLSVYWDIEQEPDFPGKYDIRVKYYNTEITFGDFDTKFENGEFFQVVKGMNGAKITSFDDEWEGIVTIGKERSDPKKFETYGNGGTAIKLGNSAILEGSVKVFVNNQLKTEYIDYTVDYFEGTITFSTPKTKDELIKVIYEFTNPIEDFIPIPNRKNFLGAQYKYTARIKNLELLATASYTEQFIISSKNLSMTIPSINLTHIPIVLGSEKITLNTHKLRKNIDYFLKHKSGNITFKKNLLSLDDKIQVHYATYKIKSTSESLQGNNTKGPFRLKHTHIIPKSITCKINQKTMFLDKDFSINAKAGKLYFNFPIQDPYFIEINYKYYISKKITPIDKQPSLNYGITYLDESVAQPDESLTQTVIAEIPSVTGNMLTTSYKPIYSTSSVVVKINNEIVPSSSITNIDLYKGIITLKTNINSPNDVRVDYVYSKSYLTETLINGKTGQNDAWYTQGVEFQLPNIPMKYLGVLSVTLRGGVFGGGEILTEGQEYIIDYGTNGLEPKIKFLMPIDNPESQLKQYPDATTTIQIKYYYTPSIMPHGGSVSQKMLGFTINSKLSPNWIVNSEFALAKHNFSKPRETYSFQTYGTGSDYEPYKLDHQNIVENSETVYLNEQLMTKDTNYFINYEQGQIKFYNLTPSKTDKIRVDYQYYVTGTTQAGLEKDAFAYKIASKYRQGNFTYYADMKQIDKDFLSIGKITEEKGTLAIGGGMLWNINKKENLSLDFHKKLIHRGYNDNSAETFLRKNIFTTIANIKLLDFISTKHKLNLEYNIEDPQNLTTTTNIHPEDTSYVNYEGEAIIGNKYFQTKFLGKLSTEEKDILDRQNLQKTIIGNMGITSTFNSWKGFPFHELSIEPSYYKSGDFEKTATSNYTYENISNASLKTSFKPNNIFNTKFEILEKTTDKITFINNTSTNNIQVLKNQYAYIGYSPYLWLKTSFDYNHTETESPLILQKGKIEDKENIAIKQYLPYGFINALNIDILNLLFRPFKGSKIATKQGNIRRFENNYKSQFYQISNRYEYNDFEPIPGIAFNSLLFEKCLSNSEDKTQTKTSSSNISLSRIFKKSGQLNIRPKLAYMNMFSYELKLDMTDIYRKKIDYALATTSNTTIKILPDFKRNQTLSFKPGNIKIGIPGIWNFSLGKLGTSVKENWEDHKDISDVTYFSNLNNKTQNELLLDNYQKLSYTYTANYAPFNIMPIKAQYLDKEEYYNRNTNPETTGTLFKKIDQLIFSSTYTPIAFLSIDGTRTLVDTKQWVSSFINLEKSSIKENFTNYLDISDLLNESNLTITPWKLMSIKGGLKWHNIRQFSIVDLQTTTHIFQTIYVAGLIFRPFEDMSLTLDYLLKETEKNTIPEGRGYGIISKYTYKPKLSDQFFANINWQLDYNKGTDLNYLEQITQEQGTQKTSDWKVITRQDLQFVASLGLDIEILLPQIQHVEKFVISGSGKIKWVKDFLFPENNYNISGIMISGKLIF